MKNTSTYDFHISHFLKKKNAQFNINQRLTCLQAKSNATFYNQSGFNNKLSR